MDKQIATGIPKKAGNLEIAAGAQSYGNLKIFLHPDKVNSLQTQEVHAPIYVRIKPTNVCNHGCFYCTYADRKEGGETSFSHMHSATKIRDKIPSEKMMEILDDFKDIGVKAVTYSGGGEPLLYPQIQGVLERTLDYGIDLSMITHGQFLMDSKAAPLRNAHWVRISQDAVTPDMFFGIRGNKSTSGEVFEKIKKNAADFAKAKDPRCVFGINFVVSDLNKDFIYRGAKMWKELGVDYVRFSPVWSPNFLEYHSFSRLQVEDQILKAQEEFNNDNFKVLTSYGDSFRATGLPFRDYTKCYIMQIVPAIGADQNVYFCHNKAYDDTGKLGSIKDQSFKKLWFSEESAKTFRDFDAHKFCQHECAADLKNIAMHQAFNNPGKLEELTTQAEASRSPHRNFI